MSTSVSPAGAINYSGTAYGTGGRLQVLSVVVQKQVEDDIGGTFGAT